MTPPTLYIKLIGIPKIIVQHENSSQTYHELPKNQQSEILLYLLIHRNTDISRADLSACLGIQNQLSVPIKKLRDYLQEITFPHATEIDTYITGKQKNSPLGLHNCQSDLQELEEYWEQCKSDPSADKRYILRECLQKIDGQSFLQGFESYLWLKPHRENVARMLDAAKQEATLILGTLPVPKQHFSRKAIEPLYQKLHAPASTTSVALWGMPGVGKTTLAAHYAEMYKGEYDYIFLVNAEDSHTIQTAYTHFHDALFPDKSHFKNREKVPLFMRWLQSQKNHLLVLDNLEHPTLLQDYVPSPFGGHLLITARRDDIDSVAHLLNVQCLTDREGIQFVKMLTEDASTAYQFDTQQALKLTQYYGGLPVALTTAIAYMRQSQLDSYRFIRILEQGNYSPNDNQKKIFLNAFEVLAPDSLKILQLIAYLAAEPVPEWALRIGVPECAWATNLNTYPAWDAVRDNLRRYSLCSYASGSYTLHRFIRQILREMTKENEQTPQLKKDVIQLINRALPNTIYTPSSEVETDYEAVGLSRREKYLHLTSHLLKCLEYVKNTENYDVHALHLLRKGVHYYLFLQDNITKAQELCDQQERLTLQLYPTLCREWIEASRLSASLNIYIENNPSAKYYALQARHYAKKLNIPLQDPTHCAILESIAFILLRMKRYKRALPFLNTAMKNAHTANQKATILLKMGDACLNLKRFEEGEKHILSAIELAQSFVDQDKTPLAVGYATLGAIYTYWGDACRDSHKYTLGAKALAEGIQLGEAHWGESHLFTADILLKQGELYCYQGSLERAKEVFERVVRICEASNYKNSRIHGCAVQWLYRIAG